MVVGTLGRDANLSADALPTVHAKYRWRHLSSSHAITCTDAILRSAPTQKSVGQQRPTKTCSVALGNAKGEVLVYDNIVDQLDKLESGKSARPPLARTLRWHREAPQTVKWSKDGKLKPVPFESTTNDMQATMSSLVATRQYCVCGS